MCPKLEHRVPWQVQRVQYPGVEPAGGKRWKGATERVEWRRLGFPMPNPSTAQVTEFLLQATALINEAYIKLINVRQVQWQDRAHFFAVSHG